MAKLTSGQIKKRADTILESHKQLGQLRDKTENFITNRREDIARGSRKEPSPSGAASDGQ